MDTWISPPSNVRRTVLCISYMGVNEISSIGPSEQCHHLVTKSLVLLTRTRSAMNACQLNSVNHIHVQ